MICSENVRVGFSLTEWFLSNRDEAVTRTIFNIVLVT